MASKTLTHAEREIEFFLKSYDDPHNRPLIEPFIPEILKLADKFGNSGQSGGSAPYTAAAIANVVQHLCLQETICPLTGDDSEWLDLREDKRIIDDTTYQNNRCYALFKNEIGSYYLDAIVWNVKETGHKWSGSAKLPNGTEIQSRQYIKEFPFTPKTFYIDVNEVELQKDDWEFNIINESQLEEVFKYYKKVE
jgi:hypothetical protein